MALDFKTEFIRVSKHKPCGICGKPDWCAVSADGALALCMRQRAGSVKQAPNGANIHILNGRASQAHSAVSARHIRRCGNCGEGRADDERLHRVYHFLLTEGCLLKPEHGDHLLDKRGLSDTTVAANLYASCPSGNAWRVICAELRAQFGEKLHGVPGFYRDLKGGWQFVPCDGFFIPVRDVRGRIVGLQVRRDRDLKPKYLWFSTRPDKFPCGASSGAPVHYAKPDLARRSGSALLTEGALKADIISESEDVAVIAVAGVTAVNPETLAAQVQREIPELQSITIAFDMDWRHKPEVKDALLRVERAMAAHFKVMVRVWDIENGKGFDDLLLRNRGVAA